jgi:hypothetical protein
MVFIYLLSNCYRNFWVVYTSDTTLCILLNVSCEKTPSILKPLLYTLSLFYLLSIRLFITGGLPFANVCGIQGCWLGMRTWSFFLAQDHISRECIKLPAPIFGSPFWGHIWNQPLEETFCTQCASPKSSSQYRILWI